MRNPLSPVPFVPPGPPVPRRQAQSRPDPAQENQGRYQEPGLTYPPFFHYTVERGESVPRAQAPTQDVTTMDTFTRYLATLGLALAGAALIHGILSHVA